MQLVRTAANQVRSILIIRGLYFWGVDYTDYTFENVGWIIRDYTWPVFFLIKQIIRVWIIRIILLVMDYSDYSGLYVIIFFCNDYTDYT